MAIDPAKREAFRGVLQQMIDDGAPEEVIQEATAKFKAKYEAPAAGMGDVKTAESQAGPVPEAPQPQGMGMGAAAALAGPVAEYGAKAGMGALKFAGDAVTSAITGPLNAAAQGIQDKGFTPSGVASALVGNQFKNLADIALPGTNRIQSTEQSFERGGVPNTPRMTTERIPVFVAKEWARTRSNGFTPEDLASIPESGFIERQRPQVGVAKEFGFMADMATPPVVGLAAVKAAGALARANLLGKAMGGAGKVAGLANRGVGRLAEEMSGVPQDALRAYGDPVQRAKMTANAGRESEIGQDLLAAVDRPDKYLPEKKAVDAALDNMGDVSLQSAIDALEGAKGAAVAGRLSPEKTAANAAIDKYIAFLRGGDVPEDISKAAPVSAKEYRRLRQDLDAPVRWDDEGGALVNSALKSGRTTMKNELLKRAAESGNPGYAKAMESWSDKLDKLDRIKKLLGKTGEARDKRVEQFINNLFGKNSEYKQELMRDLDNIFQSDITGRAKAAQNAQALGPGGIPTWLPRQMTGRSGLGLVGSIAAGTAGQAAGFGAAAPLALAGTILVASPKVAATITLPFLTAVEKAAKAGQLTLSPKAVRLMSALEKPIGEAQKFRLVQALAAEMEAQAAGNIIPFQPKKVAEEDDKQSTLSMRSK